MKKNKILKSISFVLILGGAIAIPLSAASCSGGNSGDSGDSDDNLPPLPSHSFYVGDSVGKDVSSLYFVAPMPTYDRFP
jgi:hypothetical protein